MKTLFSLCVSVILFTLSARAQDIFVFKNGSVSTKYGYIKDLPNAIQATDGTGFLREISKNKLSYIQLPTGQQHVFDNEKHPVLTLIDLQKPQQEDCYLHTGAVNAAAIDNQTPGSKATLKGTVNVYFFRDECLTSKVQTFIIPGEVVTIERVAAIDTPGFAGSYLVSFISKSGIVFKGWVRKTDFVVEGR